MSCQVILYLVVVLRISYNGPEVIISKRCSPSVKAAGSLLINCTDRKERRVQCGYCRPGTRLSGHSQFRVTKFLRSTIYPSLIVYLLTVLAGDVPLSQRRGDRRRSLSLQTITCLGAVNKMQKQ